MTLVIASGNSRETVVLSDQRLSARGVTLDEAANKTALLTTDDARVVVSFAGLGAIGRTTGYVGNPISTFRTSSYLTDALRKCASPEFQLEPLLRRLAVDLARTVNRLGQQASGIPLEILVAGYRYTPQGVVYATYKLSNRPHGSDDVQPHFQVETLGNSPILDGSYVATIGRYDCVSDLDLAELRTTIGALLPTMAVVGRATHTMLAAARNPKSCGSIGTAFNRVVLPADIRREATSHFMPDSATNEARHVNVVVETSAGSTSWSDVVLWSGEKPPPRTMSLYEPCFCDSGRQYGKCHGNPLA